MTTEEPTMEFRQVKVPFLHRTGVLGPNHESRYETVGYDTTIQRKWYIYEGDEYVGPFNAFEREDAQFVMFDTDRTKAIWRPRRAEWRDLPVVDPKDAK